MIKAAAGGKDTGLDHERRAAPQRVFPICLISFAVTFADLVPLGIAKLLFRLNFLITSASFELLKHAGFFLARHPIGTS
ncbi:MAG: hypothetical protein NVV73_21895 [Cellvibrionaceae bacterium]|nr:hypothetical protein [Cellvibrionaceae bacterium]